VRAGAVVYSPLTGHLGPRLELPLPVRNPSSGAFGRATARHYLRAWAVAEGTLDAVLQVITEFLANVHDHTVSEYAVLIMRYSPAGIRIEVRDFGESKLEGSYPTLSVAEEGDECLRGLMLVNSLAASWGSEPNGEFGLVRFAEIAHLV
jgi:histidine kinase-like protein